MNLKGTKTEKNLMEAFAGESQARNKYTYFASVAKKEGYQQIAAMTQPQTLQLLPTAKTTSGLICTQSLLTMLRKKASQTLQTSSEWLLQLKRATRKDTVHFSIMLK